MRKRSAVVAACATVACGVSYTATAASAAPPGPSTGMTFSVVASHLDNPRGLSGRDDVVYVAEGGHGDPSQCFHVAGQPTVLAACVGKTGALTRVSIDNDRSGPPQITVKQVVTGLVSIGGDPSGIASSGPAAVSYDDGHLYGLMSGNTQLPPLQEPVPAPLLASLKSQLGQLLVAKRGGGIKTLAGVGDYDYRWSARHKDLVPGQFPDSNPNAVLVDDGRAWVVDAGSNTLDLVSHGKVRVVAFFPVPAGSITDSVPTCVSKGPDGALYVGELLGGDYAPGHARVWRVVPGHRPTVWATGLTAVNGCGWSHGSFYATEFESHGLNEGPTADPSGDVAVLDRNGHITAHLGVGELFYPSGFATEDGGVFVSNCSIAPATGFGPCPEGGQLVQTGLRTH